MNTKLLAGLIFLITTYLFIGIKVDDEFGDHNLFLKYRPSFKVYFKSPLGMQDMPADYPPALKEEQRLYDKFINEKHWTDNGFINTALSGILILGTLYFLIAGVNKQFRSKW